MEFLFPYRKVLALAPHTDDVEFGCGGTISRLLREGAEVMYVAFSDCQESIPSGFPKDTLAEELASSCKELGIENVRLLDFKVRYFQRDRQRVLEELVKIKSDFAPDLILTPSSHDFHQDHKVIYEESIRAFNSRTILGYELPRNHLSLPSSCIVRLTDQDIESKILAISQYKSQAWRSYADPNYVRAQALTRGERIKTRYAEAFEMIRFII